MKSAQQINQNEPEPELELELEFGSHKCSRNTNHNHRPNKQTIELFVSQLYLAYYKWLELLHTIVVE